MNNASGKLFPDADQLIFLPEYTEPALRDLIEAVHCPGNGTGNGGVGIRVIAKIHGCFDCILIVICFQNAVDRYGQTVDNISAFRDAVRIEIGAEVIVQKQVMGLYRLVRKQAVVIRGGILAENQMIGLLRISGSEALAKKQRI